MTDHNATFDEDIKDVHLFYDYAAKNVKTGEAEKWRYEMCFFSKDNRVTSMICFSPAHWEKSEEALGDKRNKDDFERWRGLAKMGTQADRVLLSEQGEVVEKFHGKGDLEPIDESWPTI